MKSNILISMNSERKGELFLFAELILWSLFPVMTVLSYSTLSPLISLAFNTIASTLFFATVLTFKKKWSCIPSRSTMKDILLGTICIGVFFYSFVFLGMKYTSVGNTAIFLQMEVLFTVLFFNVWKKEYLSLHHILGIIFMLIASLILLFPKDFSFNIGDICIIVGTMFAPVGNYYQKRAMQGTSPEYIMFIRSAISAPCILLLALLLGEQFTVFDIHNAFWLIVINGCVLLGLSKVLWLEAIHRISVTKAISLASFSAFLTLLFSFLLLHEIPTITQIIAVFPMMLGIILMTSRKKYLQVTE